MKTIIKSIAIALIAIVTTVEAGAQKIAAAAIVDQHNAAEASNYKIMMLGLAGIYAVYMMMSMKRRREISRIMGKSK